MTSIVTQPISLEAFLQLPETKPASEYVEGSIIQKPMPKAKHARLQGKLMNAINAITEDAQIAYAFPELRCTFADRSIVPDIAVLVWDRIAFDQAGEPLDNVTVAPDWTIEILSPEQSSNRVMGNILHCLQHGCRLGWLLDPDDRSILVFSPNQLPKLYRLADQSLPVLPEIPLQLTVKQIFGWLKMKDVVR